MNAIISNRRPGMFLAYARARMTPGNHLTIVPAQSRQATTIEDARKIAIERGKLIEQRKIVARKRQEHIERQKKKARRDSLETREAIRESNQNLPEAYQLQAEYVYKFFREYLSGKRKTIRLTFAKGQNAPTIPAYDPFFSAWKRNRADQSCKVNGMLSDVVSLAYLIFSESMAIGLDSEGNLQLKLTTFSHVAERYVVQVFPHKTIRSLFLASISSAVKQILRDNAASQNLRETADGQFESYADNIGVEREPLLPTVEQAIKAIETLPTKQRDILRFAYDQRAGKKLPSNRHIAKTMGVHSSKVKAAFSAFQRKMER